MQYEADGLASERRTTEVLALVLDRATYVNKTNLYFHKGLPLKEFKADDSVLAARETGLNSLASCLSLSPKFSRPCNIATTSRSRYKIGSIHSLYFVRMFIPVDFAVSSCVSKCCSGVVSIELGVDIGWNRVARLFLDLNQLVSVKHKLEAHYVLQLQ